MENIRVNLEDDISALLKTLNNENINIDKELVIYCLHDKHLPGNSITYRNEETVQALQERNVLQIIRKNGIPDDTAPHFMGPLYYTVIVYAEQLKLQSGKVNKSAKQLPKHLPKNVVWHKSPSNCSLTFPDKKFLEFESIKPPSAQYFCLLIENYGIPLAHKIACKKIKPKCEASKIYGLKKSILEKTKRSGLKKNITINSNGHGSFYLTIYP